MQYKSYLAILVAVLGAAFIVARPYVRIGHPKTLTVKGTASMPLRSDMAVFVISTWSSSPTLDGAYKQSHEDFGPIISMVQQVLGDDAKKTELNSEIQETMQLDSEGRKTSKIEYYTVKRSLRVETPKIDLVYDLIRKVYDLNARGIRATVSGPEYFVTNIDQAKVVLADLAARNGRERAECIASAAGARLGKLLSARQGVIQITKPNSSDMSDWGVYDTETVEKEAKLVVTREFEVL